MLPVHYPVTTPRGRGCSCGNPECEGNTGKHPLTPKGIHDASKDPDVIQGWWRAHPHANLGLACGAPSGVDVLDVDGDAGRATLAELEAQHGPLPKTVRARTGRQDEGEHYYFSRRPESPFVSVSGIAPGLDARGDGGYVIAPPSRHLSGKFYEWAPGCALGEVALASAPDWLCALASARSERGSTEQDGTRGRSGRRNPLLDRQLVLAGVPEGQRNDQLFREVASLHHSAVPKEEATITALALAAQCKPPLAEREVLSIVDSAYSYLMDRAKDPVEIKKAAALVTAVIERVTKRNEHGAAWEADTLEALAIIRDGDPPTLARARQAFRDADIDWKAIERKIGKLADDAPGEGERQTQADQLLEIVGDSELFRTPEGDSYATITVDSHKETWRIGALPFRQWLSREFYSKVRRIPSTQALTDSTAMLSGRAQFEGKEIPVFTRVGERDGVVYLDLANANWEAVEIRSDGWSVISDPPVKFRRAKGMRPIPQPTRGGSVSAFYNLVNVPAQDDQKLVTGWLLNACRPKGPYWGMILQGEQGSAKSTLARHLRSIFDPSAVPLRAPPREERDIMIGARNSWVLTYDNLSGVPLWGSDALCRILTGGGLSLRELYTDDGETLFSATRPVILNGIDAIATRPDLANRSIILHLPSIPNKKRRRESEIDAGFVAAWPSILGALLDAVSAGLANAPRTKLDASSRMADALHWVSAAEPALGWEPGKFAEAYAKNEAEAGDAGLDSDPVGVAIMGLVAKTKGSWSADPIAATAASKAPIFKGTATDLLVAAGEFVTDATKRSKEWPTNARVMSDRLKRIEPLLRAKGYTIERRKSGDRHLVIWEGAPVPLSGKPLERDSEPCVPSAHRPPSSSDTDLERAQTETAAPTAFPPAPSPSSVGAGTPSLDAAPISLRPASNPSNDIGWTQWPQRAQESGDRRGTSGPDSITRDPYVQALLAKRDEFEGRQA